MNTQSTTHADSNAEHHRTELTRREFLGSIVGAVTSLVMEPKDPPDLPPEIPFGARWHMWWPGTLDGDTIDRMVWSWDWPIPDEQAEAILRAAANREYSIEELRENADIKPIYKEMRPPNQAYVK